jgi:hypothetical protein
MKGVQVATMAVSWSSSWTPMINGDPMRHNGFRRAAHVDYVIVKR